MSNTAWLIVALAIVFIAIGGYTASLLIRSKRSKARLEQLSREALTHYLTDTRDPSDVHRCTS